MLIIYIVGKSYIVEEGINKQFRQGVKNVVAIMKEQLGFNKKAVQSHLYKSSYMKTSATLKPIVI